MSKHIRSSSDAREEWAEEDRQRKIELLLNPDRYYMKKGETRKVVFVENDGPAVSVHSRNFGRLDKVFVPCSTPPKGKHEDCCELLGRSPKDRYRALVWTVVDMHLFKSKDGAERGNELCLYESKWQSSEPILDVQQAYGLAYTVLDIKRFSSNHEPNVGSKYTHIRKVQDVEAFFRATYYKGTPLAVMWDRAEADPKYMAILKRLFQLEFDASGRLLRKVVPFNYEEVYRPWERSAIEEVSRRPVSKNGKHSKKPGFESTRPGDITF